MNDDILKLLGLMYVSNNLAIGESVITSLSKRDVYLVIYANDLSIASRKKVLDKTNFYSIPAYEYSSKEGIANAIGKGEVGVVGIKSKKMAIKIENILKGMVKI